VTILGHVGGAHVRLGGLIDLTLSQVTARRTHALEEALALV
jgi:hypothetical protein